MANEEHLKILKQGVEAWNEWREKNPQITPDLSKANLNAADLYEADLSKGNLYNDRLSSANGSNDVEVDHMAEVAITVAEIDHPDTRGSLLVCRPNPLLCFAKEGVDI